MKVNGMSKTKFQLATTFGCALLATTAFLTPLAQSETVRIPIGQGTETWNGKMPKRGQTKAQVQSEFGSPRSTQGPNGQPPIYFWEYPDFTVYFEADHVIHTVLKHRQKAS